MGNRGINHSDHNDEFFAFIVGVSTGAFGTGLAFWFMRSVGII